MKKVLFLFILLFALHAYGLKLSAPTKVPAGSSFAVLAEIGETNFNKIAVFVDDVLVFSQSLSANPNLQYIASYIPYDPSTHKELVLVFRPLDAGNYAIKVKLLKASSTVAEKELSLSVFAPVESSSIQSLSHTVDIVNENMKLLKEKNSSLSTDIDALQKALSEIKTGFSSLKTELETTKETVGKNSEAYATLNSSIGRFQTLLNTEESKVLALGRDVENKYKDLNASITSLSARLAKLEKQQNRVTTGFITLGQSIALASVAILVILALTLVLKKRRSIQDSLFESSEKGPAYNDEHSAMVDDILASQSDNAGGKWAYKGHSDEKPTEEKRFSLGDLIKRS